MIATRGMTLKDHPYPRVHEKETQIQELERQLRFIIQKGESLIVQKKALMRLPDTPSTKQQWEEFRVQIIANKSEKDFATEKLTLFKKDLPQLQDAAERAEVDLAGKKEELKGIKTQIEKIDNAITKAVIKPMALIKERQETIHLFQKADQLIASLTSKLRWHPPTPEEVPAEPKALEALINMFPKQFVRWRGKN